MRSLRGLGKKAPEVSQVNISESEIKIKSDFLSKSEMLSAGAYHCTIKKERLLRVHDISESEKKIKNESRSESESEMLNLESGLLQTGDQEK